MTVKLDVKAEAEKLLHNSNVFSLPIDVEAVAEYLSIRVLYEDFDDETSGLLVVKNGKRAIGVNRRHHPNRQRFTIAHEIGHFVLHHDNFEDPKNEIHIDKKWAYFRSAAPTAGGNEREEYEANQFAAELLMPEELVKQLIKKSRINLTDDFDIANLASMLKVSEQALTIRLVALKLIKPY
jgi:Zn-dependent peptidase ImmA (M78 family)